MRPVVSLICCATTSVVFIQLSVGHSLAAEPRLKIVRGAEFEFTCSGERAIGYRAKVTEVYGDRFKLTTTREGGKVGFSLRPTWSFGLQIHYEFDSGDGHGKRKFQFDEEEMSRVTQLSSGDSLHGKVSVSFDQSGESIDWEYNISHVGTESIKLELADVSMPVEFITDVYEVKRHAVDVNHDYRSILWSYVEKNSKVPVKWRFEDEAGTTFCSLSDFVGIP